MDREYLQKMNKKFKKAWNNLIELEKSENIESSDYKDNLLDVLNDLFNHWPEDISNVDLADELNTTVAKLSSLKFLSSTEEEELVPVLENHRNTALLFQILKIPEDKRGLFLKNAGRMRSNVARLVKMANDLFNGLSEIEKNENTNPWIKKISHIDKSIWEDISIEAKGWGMKATDIKKIEKFKTARKKSIEEWEWLRDFVDVQIQLKNIAPKNVQGETMNHHAAIIEAWKRIK